MNDFKNSQLSLSKFCQGKGLEIGIDSFPIVCTSIKLIQKNSFDNLSFISDSCFDFVYTSYFLNKFNYEDIKRFVLEMRRTLKFYGYLILSLPNKEKYLKYSNQNNINDNLKIIEHDLSLESYRNKVLPFTLKWNEIYAQDEFGDFSWHLVLKKLRKED